MKISLSVIVILIAYLAAGCASKSILSEGTKGVVRYQEFNPDSGDLKFELVLVQETNNDYKRILSDKTENSFIKKTSDDRYCRLVETLVNEHNFLDFLESAPTKTKASTSLKTVSVKNEFGNWILRDDHCIGVCKGNELPNYFIGMINTIRDYYDSAFALQVIIEKEDKGRAQFFRDQKEKIDNARLRTE